MSRTLPFLLSWIERALVVAGIALGLWCVLLTTEARFFTRLPIPPSAAQKPLLLPGEESSPQSRAILERGTWIARLDAPSVQLSATVLEGSDDATLARAAGHIESTAAPGDVGNIGVAGHRDTTFRALRHLKLGDALLLTTSDRVFEYRVNDTMIVDPDAVYVLDPTPEPTLTLVTCYPFTFIGHAPQRYIVRATLVGEQGRKPGR